MGLNRFVSILLTFFVVISTTLGSFSASANPTLREMAAQMIMVGLGAPEAQPQAASVVDSATSSPSYDEASLRHISRLKLGGVMMLTRDIRNRQSIRALTQRLQADAESSGNQPLFISVDEEGGRVQRLRGSNGFRSQVSAQEMGALTTQQMQSVANEIAREVRCAGFNLNFAPVVDVNVNPNNPVIGGLERSFSADPLVVFNRARQFIQSHRNEHVLTSIKHFPGHGNTTGDTHAGFVDMTTTWRRDVELYPYQQLISRNLVDSVMTGHLFHEQLDSEQSASLSYRVVTGLLRGELGFSGVVFSDDLQMGAVTTNLRDTVKLTVLSGTDILLYPQYSRYDNPETILNTLMDLIRTREISATRIQESYQRIVALKQRTWNMSRANLVPCN